MYNLLYYIFIYNIHLKPLIYGRNRPLVIHPQDPWQPLTNQRLVDIRVGRRPHGLLDDVRQVLLAHETATIEPAIRVGYNFGRKIKH